MSGRKLQPEHHELIAELGERGKSDAYICDKLKEQFGLEISTSAISWHRLRLCAEPDRVVAVRPVPTAPITIERGGHTLRRFTQDEDAELLRLEATGLSDTEIGRRLGRAPNSVRGRLMTLARHEARRERAAEQSAMAACAPRPTP